METKVKKATRYCCAECGCLVEVNARGAVQRECGHDEAGVIASVSATTHGAGSMLHKDVARQ